MRPMFALSCCALVVAILSLSSARAAAQAASNDIPGGSGPNTACAPVLQPTAALATPIAEEPAPLRASLQWLARTWRVAVTWWAHEDHARPVAAVRASTRWR